MMCESNNAQLTACSHHTLREDLNRSCLCLVGDGCLFSDMRPLKILSVVAAARAAGITHVIEQGRYGGLSAVMYAQHGLRVTSIERLPLASIESALRTSAPSVEIVNGDGREEVIRLTRGLDARTAARTMVIFDGEKRMRAWTTFEQVREHVALAVFDDTNLGDNGRAFTTQLHATGQVWWDTRNISDATLWAREQAPLQLTRELSRGLSKQERRLEWTVGGLDFLEQFHLSLVRGCAWL